MFSFIFLIKRAFSFFFVVLKYGVFSAGENKIYRPKGLRKTFEDLGGVFIKFGQILSVRYDLLSSEYCEELLSLLDKVKPMTSAEIDKVFLTEFKKLPSVIFAEFNYLPLASASFGQVHLAHLPNGEKAAIKVQRHNLKKILSVDFLFFRLLAFFIDLSGFLKSFSLGEVAKEFREWTLREIDYRIEAQHLRDFRKHSEKYPNIIVPRVFDEYSTKKILAMEFIEGFSLSDIIANLQNAKYISALKEKRIELPMLSKKLLQDGMILYFIEGVLQADPHPANIIAIPENRLGYIDLGIMAYFGSERVYMIKFLEAISEKKYRIAASSFVHYFSAKLSIPKEELNKHPELNGVILQIKEILTEKLAKKFELLMGQWYENIENPQKSLAERSASLTFFKMLESAGNIGIKPPAEMILFLRTLAIIDIVALKIDNSFNLLSVIQDFLSEYGKIVQQTKENLSLAILQEKIQHLQELSQNKILEEAVFEKQLNWLLNLAQKNKDIYNILPPTMKKLV